MKKNLGFRAWFFFRTGWSTYFALIFAAVNTMIVTYYLAIENIPALKTVFPSFLVYFAVLVSIGIPVLILVGYIHYKRTTAFSSEMDIYYEANPYHYKVPPGFWKEVIIPLYLLMSEIMVKTSKDKLTEEQIQRMEDLQKKMDILLQGGRIGHPTRDLSDKDKE